MSRPYADLRRDLFEKERLKWLHGGDAADYIVVVERYLIQVEGRVKDTEADLKSEWERANHLEARLARAAALEPYTNYAHLPGCKANSFVRPHPGCTCGLDAVLAEQEKEQPKDAEIYTDNMERFERVDTE